MIQFRKSPFIWAFLFLIIPILTQAFQTEGVWVTRWDLYSEDFIKEIIDSLSTANVKDAFVQVYGSGYAYYNSGIAPRKYEDFDPLRTFIDYARQKNIRVHAWINLLYMWDRREMTEDRMHILNRYPESVLVDDRGVSLLDYSIEKLKNRNIEGFYVSPSSEIVNDYILLIIDEIAKNYSVDGIHLDYSRFPGKEFIHDQFIKSDFQKIYTILPEQKDEYANKRIFGTGMESIVKAWSVFPKESLNRLIKRIYFSVKDINPNLQVSSAVIADVGRAENEFYQCWWEWLNGKYMDFVVIMAYSANINVLEKQIDAVKGKTSLDNVVIGLATYNQTMVNVRNNFEALLVYPVMGYCLFSNRSIYDSKGYKYVGTAIFK